MKNTILTYKKELNNRAELGWNEYKTTDFIFQSLKTKPTVYGWGKSKTGLLYKVGSGKNTILIRSDIDALKTNTGVQHICGHSTHTAGLMGAFLYAKQHIVELNRLDKSIYFLFQPAEETYPSGAAAFLTEYKNHLKEIRYAFAVHVRPLLPLNSLVLSYGVQMSRGDYFEFQIQGKMVHVKNCIDGIDAIESASAIVLEIKKLQKKRQYDMRINIGLIQGGLQANTVADFAVLKGDIRLKENAMQKTIKNELIQIAYYIQKQFHTKVTLTYYSGYPVLQNNMNLTSQIACYFKKKTTIKPSSENLFSFGCEDFSFIAQKIPSVFAFLGTGDKYDIHMENCTISDKGTIFVFDYFSHIINWWLSV